MRRGGCSWARRQKWRYLDKTLPAPVSRQVEAHLAVCLPCRAEFAQAQEALDALRAGKPLTPEQQRMLQSAGNTPVWKRAVAVLLLLALVGVGAYLWRLPSDTLLTRLSVRGASPEPIPVPPPDALPPELPPAKDAEPPSALKPEPLNILEALQPAPPPAETPEPPPAPKVEVKPRPVPPAPAVEQPRKPPASSPPRRRANPQPPPRSQPKPAVPAEGTVEVYDEAGNLIRREQLQEPRR